MNENSQKPSGRLTDIFINYRRKDTAGHAGRLQQDLNERFPGRVFMDIHNIEAGRDFTEAIAEEVGRCGVLIVMIGDQWLNITDPETGKRRLDDPNDLVAIEIAEALKRDTRVIPVLVEGARMPQQAELPPALSGLVRRNAFELSDTRWPYDVEQLGNQLEKTCGRSPQGVAVVAKAFASTAGEIAAGNWGPRRISKLVILLIVAAATVLIVLKLMKPTVPAPPDDHKSVTVSPTPTPTPGPDGNSVSTSAEPVLKDYQVVVKLPKAADSSNAVDSAEATFDFPFDAGGSEWKWYREDSPPNEDEYNWEVRVKDASKKIAYLVTVYVKKGNDSKPGNGDFASLIEEEAKKGVATRPLNVNNFGPLEDWQGKIDIQASALRTGLQLIIKGKGVEQIFKDRPRTVLLRTTNPHFNLRANDHTLKVSY